MTFSALKSVNNKDTLGAPYSFSTAKINEFFKALTLVTICFAVIVL